MGVDEEALTFVLPYFTKCTSKACEYCRIRCRHAIAVERTRVMVPSLTTRCATMTCAFAARRQLGCLTNRSHAQATMNCSEPQQQVGHCLEHQQVEADCSQVYRHQQY